MLACVKDKGALHQTKYNYPACRSVLLPPLVKREKYAFLREQLIAH